MHMQRHRGEPRVVIPDDPGKGFPILCYPLLSYTTAPSADDHDGPRQEDDDDDDEEEEEHGQLSEARAKALGEVKRDQIAAQYF